MASLLIPDNHSSDYQPLDEYRVKYKDLHCKNASDFFEACVRQSCVDEAVNRVIVSNINKRQREINKHDVSRRKKKTLKGFLIFFTALAAIVFVVFGVDIFYNLFENTNLVTLVTMSGSAAIAFIFIQLIIRKLNPVIKQLNALLERLKSELDTLIKEAWTQVAPLVALFDKYTAARLFEKTYPLIALDNKFNIKRYDYLSRKFGLWDNSDPNVSTLHVQSGEINGNPFCFFKTLNHFMSVKTYVGSKTIFWTEHFTDANGKMRTRPRMQTLHAEVTKPFPDYFEDTFLVYGNEAAPNLIFSRKQSAANTMNDRQLKKYIKRETKKLESLMRERISRGENFTALGNAEFETLFGATDRNNEIEFRVLFTPVAQRELLKLIKDKTVAWGDDFEFRKKQMLNIITPSHLRNADISGSLDNYIHYDINEMRKRFLDYNNLYFKNIYFTFAPLLAIPLYQQHKTHEFIYKDVYPQHFCGFEHEFSVNKMDTSNFVSNNSITHNILKTRLLTSNKQTDKVMVTAHGFSGENRTDYVSVWGGDGKLHSIAVNWTLYLPVEKETEIEI